VAISERTRSSALIVSASISGSVKGSVDLIWLRTHVAVSAGVVE
jgi:hypothetical protein